jgi:hypothetical protein
MEQACEILSSLRAQVYSILIRLFSVLCWCILEFALSIETFFYFSGGLVVEIFREIEN